MILAAFTFPKPETPQELPKARQWSTEDLCLADTEPRRHIDRAADRGAHVLGIYARKHDKHTDDYETVMVDLLADVLHLCDALGMDFAELERSARTTYLGDRETL